MVNYRQTHKYTKLMKEISVKETNSYGESEMGQNGGSDAKDDRLEQQNNIRRSTETT